MRLVINSFQLRAWQAEAKELIKVSINDGKKDFLCVATPGGGKTNLALAFAREAIESGFVQRVVIVVPTEHLKKQWAQNAALNFGIDLDPYFKNDAMREASDYDGVVITYAQLGKDPQVHKYNTERAKTLAIFDEVHHAGDSLSWGQGVLIGFENAIFRLEMSGTPFRCDDAKIPFITYENEVSKADYEYSYEQAMLDNVCRPVYFPAYDGKMKYKVGAEIFEHSFMDRIENDLVSKRLKTALATGGGWLRQVISEAHAKLVEIRRGEHPNAGGLIFAINQKHAKDIQKVVHAVTGTIPEIVISEDTDGSRRIEGFTNSYEPWIVCVKMISEGVDIPRLRVGVYATNVKAELFFRQAMGRFVRYHPPTPSLSRMGSEKMEGSYIYIPMDPDITKMAKEIQEEREHSLAEAERTATTDLFGNPVNDYVPARQGKFIPLSSEALQATVYQTSVEIGSGAKMSVVQQTEQTVYEQKRRLKERINSIAKNLALKEAREMRLERPDFPRYHRMWIDNGGKNIELETLPELEKRLNWLLRQQ